MLRTRTLFAIRRKAVDRDRHRCIGEREKEEDFRAFFASVQSPKLFAFPVFASTLLNILSKHQLQIQTHQLEPKSIHIYLFV